MQPATCNIRHTTCKMPERHEWVPHVAHPDPADSRHKVKHVARVEKVPGQICIKKHLQEKPTIRGAGVLFLAQRGTLAGVPSATNVPKGTHATGEHKDLSCFSEALDFSFPKKNDTLFPKNDQSFFRKCALCAMGHVERYRQGRIALAMILMTMSVMKLISPIVLNTCTTSGVRAHRLAWCERLETVGHFHGLFTRDARSSSKAEYTREVGVQHRNIGAFDVLDLQPNRQCAQQEHDQQYRVVPIV